jgi:hypothetical protein
MIPSPWGGGLYRLGWIALGGVCLCTALVFAIGALWLLDILLRNGLGVFKDHYPMVVSLAKKWEKDRPNQKLAQVESENARLRVELARVEEIRNAMYVLSVSLSVFFSEQLLSVKT